MMLRAALRTLVAGSVALALAVWPVPAQAQLARQRGPDPNAPKLMVVPFQREGGDSALAVTIADGARDRIATAIPYRFNVIAKGPMNENLAGSGFPVDVPLEISTVRQLARFLNARAVLEGNILRRPGDSVLVIARLGEVVGPNPQSATAVTVVPRARAGAAIGGELANRLLDAYRSFEHVTACNRWVDSSNYARAQQAVDRALQAYAGSATAYLCLARIRRGANAPPDSILAALLRAHDSDSLNSLVLRQLATIYQERADTTAMLHELHHVLSVDVRDNDLRIRVARLYVQRGMPDTALVIVDEGLVANPSSVELLQTKSIALAADNRWRDAATTLSQVAEVDSSNIDSLFAVRITNYYRSIPDSAALLTWLRIVTTRLADQVPYHYSLGEMLFVVGDTAGAIEANRRYMALNPADGRGHLAAARYLAAARQYDSALVHVDAVMGDSTLRTFTPAIYLQAGLQAYRDSNWTRAAALLGQARPYATGRVLTPVAFFLGLSQVQLGVVADNDAQTNRNCDAARRAGDLWNSAEQNIIAGVAQNRDAANQLLSQVIPAYKQRADAMTRNFCR